MLKGITRYAVIVCLLVCGGNQLFACVTDPGSGFSQYYRLPSTDPKYVEGTLGDFNDWGAISIDADNPSCAKQAHDRLLQKLRTTPTAYFQQPLAGYSVALIFAAAQRIGAYGWFNTSNDPIASTDTLAGQLDRIYTNYQEHSNAGDCDTGLQGNSCMDDLAGYAAAHAWMSAFKKKRGDTDTWYEAYVSGQKIAGFFNNLCYHSGGATISGQVCNSTYEEFAAGRAEVFPFEHERETPHYGFGLLTSIAQSIVGLEAAGAAYNLSTEERVKAQGLMKNIQSHANNGSNWNSPVDCRNPEPDGFGGWYAGSALDCGDTGDGGYQPLMYHLNEFFQQHVGGTTTGSYQSNAEFGWPNLTNFGNTFSYGRYATYHEQGYTWYVNRGNQYSSRYMPFNNNSPQGYLDRVDSNGVAIGWACDADAPNSFVKVDFFAQGTKISDDQTQYAWFGSEPAVNSLCGGGSAHRFSVQLPAWVQGYQIEARARDYTFGPTLTLTCLESPACVW